MQKRILSLISVLALAAALIGLPGVFVSADTLSDDINGDVISVSQTTAEEAAADDTGTGGGSGNETAGTGEAGSDEENADPEDTGEDTNPDDDEAADNIEIIPDSQGSPPDDDGDEADLPYAPDRVIVKIASNPRLRSFPYLGIEFSDIRVINPSEGQSESGGMQMYSASGGGSQDDTYVITLEETGAAAVENALEILNANPAVEFAQPDYRYEIFLTPDDYNPAQQYALEKINAPVAWDLTTGSKNIVVGITDTGILGSHPDLAANLWENPDVNPSMNDIHGYCFGRRVGGTPTDPTIPGANGNGHGTHVAGIVGAKGNNGIGITGINWDVSIAWLGIRDSNGQMYTTYAVEAINYARNKDIPVINASWGGYGTDTALYNAVAAYPGLFIASAGNETNNNDANSPIPAGYNLPNVIAVASTDRNDNISSFSNYGTRVHIAAPGSDIRSTLNNGSYGNESGTSMAAPYVAGVAALVLSVYPECTSAQLKDYLLDTARPEASLNQWGGFGILDAGAAVSQAFDDAKPTGDITGLYGDVNNDGRVNGTDVQALILWINAGRPPGRINERMARVCSIIGRPDAQDVQALVQWINEGGIAANGHPGP